MQSRAFALLFALPVLALPVLALSACGPSLPEPGPYLDRETRRAWVVEQAGPADDLAEELDGLESVTVEATGGTPALIVTVHGGGSLGGFQGWRIVPVEELDRFERVEEEAFMNAVAAWGLESLPAP